MNRYQIEYTFYYSRDVPHIREKNVKKELEKYERERKNLNNVFSIFI